MLFIIMKTLTVNSNRNLQNRWSYSKYLFPPNAEPILHCFVKRKWCFLWSLTDRFHQFFLYRSFQCQCFRHFSHCVSENLHQDGKYYWQKICKAKSLRVLKSFCNVLRLLPVIEDAYLYTWKRKTKLTFSIFQHPGCLPWEKNLFPTLRILRLLFDRREHRLAWYFEIYSSSIGMLKYIIRLYRMNLNG